jgi:putative cell wall-binding protein
VTKGYFRCIFSLATCFLLTFFAVPAFSYSSESGSIEPSQWPSSLGMRAEMEAWPNAIRFFGADRYQTSLTSSLALRGTGGFPYETPDPSSLGASNLSAASQWWGVGLCPRAVIIIAGDSSADALAAASLSDSTGLSDEPYLQRSASADPLFDPVGGFSKVNTDFAPVLVTMSTRDGAQTLSPAISVAVQDLRNGGCTTARQAILVGGTSAVPSGVDDELISLGFDEVFRVKGNDRFSTAALIARALGTKEQPENKSSCSDLSSSDGNSRMQFYANSVVEWRPSANECHLLGKTVVLADGVTGADAISAGWWTSFWQVPVLLHDGSEELPTATAATLQSLDIENIIVLGGVERVSDGVVEEAVAATGANYVRVAGVDRYATSIAMAQQFGGWWPTGRGDEFSSSLLCLAASSGSGRASTGWPDALGAGAWCAMASGSAGNPGAPQRALGPVTGKHPALVSIPPRPMHDAVPVILVGTGQERLPESVSAFLTEVFQPADSWCSSVSSPTGCSAPGFGVVFGGPSVITDSLISQFSSILSGGTSGEKFPVDAILADTITELSMAPLYYEVGDFFPGRLKACFPRSSYENARWLSIGFEKSSKVELSLDVMMQKWHVSDADSVSRGLNGASPGCISFNPEQAENIWLRSSGIEGRSSATAKFGVSYMNRLTLTGDIKSEAPVAMSGIDSRLDPVMGGESILVFLSTVPTIGIASKGLITVVESAGITLTLKRGETGARSAPDSFNATWNIATSQGTVVGTATGEALLINGTWKLRGSSKIIGGTLPSTLGAGGFSLDLDSNGPGLGDDEAFWRFDSVRVDQD